MLNYIKSELFRVKKSKVLIGLLVVMLLDVIYMFISFSDEGVLKLLQTLRNLTSILGC